jgi:hypothetical protein
MKLIIAIVLKAKKSAEYITGSERTYANNAYTMRQFYVMIRFDKYNKDVECTKQYAILVVQEQK